MSEAPAGVVAGGRAPLYAGMLSDGITPSDPRLPLAVLPTVPGNMGPHMKTTIDLADSLLADAKRVAAEEDTTLRALVEAGLREVLAKRRSRATPFRLRRVTVKGKGLRTGLRNASWQQLRDLAYGDPAS